MITALANKTKRLCEVLVQPRGLKYKLGEPSFSPPDFNVCRALSCSGISPNTIFDIGANIGQFSLAATTYWPKASIHCYEPVAAAFEQLAKLSHRHPALHPHNFALGARSGSQPIHVSNLSQSSSFFIFHENHRNLYPRVHEIQTVNVDMRTLNEEFTLHSGPSPRLLKLDVQGFEAEVIRGGEACLEGFQWILLETSNRPMYEGETCFTAISNTLQRLGFEFLFPAQIHYAPGGGLGQFDALFIQK